MSQSDDAPTLEEFGTFLHPHIKLSCSNLVQDKDLESKNQPPICSLRMCPLGSQDTIIPIKLPLDALKGYREQQENHPYDLSVCICGDIRVIKLEPKRMFPKEVLSDT